MARNYLFALSILMATTSTQAQVLAKPGEYSYSVKLQLFGMSMPSMTFKRCVTQQDIEDGKAYVNTDKIADCTNSKVKWSGNEFTVDSTCTNPERIMSGQGKATENSFDMTMNVTVKGDMPMKQKQIISAQRVGDCSQ